jgi:Glutathione-dependent formaldehyde-activating enzyme
MCHYLECQRRTGAVISNQARFRLEQVSFAGKTTAWTRTAESGNAMTYHFCDMRLYRFLGERRFPRLPLPLATLPIRASRRRPSRCGRRHATLGSSLPLEAGRLMLYDKNRNLDIVLLMPIFSLNAAIAWVVCSI